MALVAQPGPMPGGAAVISYAAAPQVYAPAPPMYAVAPPTLAPAQMMPAAVGMPMNAPAPAPGLPAVPSYPVKAQNAEKHTVYYPMDPVKKAENVQGEEKMAIFDFDNTLTQAMVYHDLQILYRTRNEPTLQMAMAQPEAWWVAEFGGAARIQMLDSSLGKLRSMGVKCYVCSMNVPEIIEYGLSIVKVDAHFRNEEGIMRIVPKVTGASKGKRVQMMLDKHSAEPTNAVFVDDLPQNCMMVENEVHGIATVNCGKAGVTEREFSKIISAYVNDDFDTFEVNKLKAHTSVLITANDAGATVPSGVRKSKKSFCGLC
mmetsp:Transcript_94666/g.156458  ORF Transcript_94666/g.156458 Transcript_94666/m.156458 type:complete len:316 (+) Transcript_94666:74-1021(+)